MDLSLKDVNNLLEQVSPVYQQCRSRPGSFMESHVSANTFLENKNGYHSIPTNRPFILPFQIRTFKTYRSGDVDERNSSMSARLRSKFQGSDVKRLALGNINDMSARDIKGMRHYETINC